MGVAYKETPPAPDLGFSPFFHGTSKVLAGDDTIEIQAGEYVSFPHIWQIEQIMISVTTDATVLDRYARIGHTYVKGNDAWFMMSAGIAASQVGHKCRYTAFQSQNGSGGEYFSGDEWWQTNPALKIIGPLGQFKVSLYNGQSGDTFYVYYVLKFLNHELGMGQIQAPIIPPPPPKVWPPPKFD